MESKKEILVVSFGTSFNDSRSITIGAIESTLQEQFPEWRVHRAFSSEMIVSALWKRENIRIDTPREAMERAVNSGVDILAIQPTFFVKGKEFDELKEQVLAYSNQFKKIVLAEPLLSKDEDYHFVIKALDTLLSGYQSEDTAVCFMGHGTSLAANLSYLRMQNFMKELHQDWYVATLKARPDIWEILNCIQQKNRYKKVVLVPLMVVAGRHVYRDMAGSHNDSWKCIFENAGYDVTCILEGMGQYYGIQQVYIKHMKEAIALYH